MKKQICVISGASRGIGYATAELFLKNEWQVVNISRNICRLDNVININFDLGEENWIATYNDAITTHLANADQICLIHNAAYYHSDALLDVTQSVLRQAFEINIVAPSLLNQLIIPYMPSGSSIIYIGSTLSEIAVANTLSYTTMKHAVLGFMRATCQDLAKLDKRIHTLAICPGFTDTEMLREHIPENQMNAVKNKVGANRLIDPAEIAQTIYSTTNQPVLNGAVIHANLGQIQ